MTLEIFTATGGLRRDFSEAEVETLPIERRGGIFKLLTASTEADAAEQEFRDANANVTACVRALASAEEAHRVKHPPRTFIEELRATINRPKE